jgi:CheY-like chemotaxis protein
MPLQPEHLQRVRVLIVDDLAENRSMLELCCDRFGMLHESVENGLQAVEAARSGRFDVILMDTFMLRMDGMTATRAIRALEVPASLAPIIAMAPAPTPGEVSVYLACGMNDVVSRPIDPARLLAALSAALAKVGRDRWPKAPPNAAKLSA